MLASYTYLVPTYLIIEDYYCLRGLLQFSGKKFIIQDRNLKVSI